ncbi:MAG: hypothetical protein K8M05_30940 [Deltaproteobacteria bacterium]|nr:hypothetical protein [Kofleriaceae bacterium]
MAVLWRAVNTQRLARWALLLCAAAVILAPTSVRASSDDEDETKTLAIGDTVTGTFTNVSPVYHFEGHKDEIVTITLEGKTAEQIGVVMVRSDKALDIEWITGHFMDDFASSGNIRDGHKLHLTLRLPMTTEYMVYIRDASFNEEEAPYSLTLRGRGGGGGGGPGATYVRGSLGGGVAVIGLSASPAVNATFSVGRHRTSELGIEGVVSATVIPTGDTSVIGLVGIGIRAHKRTSPVRLRYAVGLAGMRGVTDHLGGGLRMDVLGKRVTFGMEVERVGRTNLAMALFGLAL